MELLTVDECGRVLIPQKLREQLGLHNDAQLSVEIQDGKLVLTPLPLEPQVYREGGVLVVQSEPIGDLEKIIDELRSERITKLASW